MSLGHSISECTPAYDVNMITPLEIFVKILTKTLPRSMQESDIRIMEEPGLKMGQDLSQIYVWPMQDLDMVEPWYTQDPYKDQYARFLHG